MGYWMIVLDEKNILLGLEAEDRNDCIRKIAAVMEKNGYLGPDYAEEAIRREEQYPTGLPTDGVVVAIPHANKGTVHHTGIGMAVLAKPVPFYNMADHGQQLQVEMVFLLANTDPNQQLDDLRRLMECFCEEELLQAMKAAKEPGDVLAALAQVEP